MKASYDNLELTIVLVYRGKPPVILHRRAAAPVHEEAAASTGLAGYFLGNVADRTSVTTSELT